MHFIRVFPNLPALSHVLSLGNGLNRLCPYLPSSLGSTCVNLPLFNKNSRHDDWEAHSHWSSHLRRIIHEMNISGKLGLRIRSCVFLNSEGTTLNLENIQRFKQNL